MQAPTPSYPKSTVGLTFPKSERLRHRSLVESVFKGGDTMYEYPLRMSWHIVSDEAFTRIFRDMPPKGVASLQMMVTVPKKKRRHAVDRVRMRRLIREAYRLRRRPLRQLTESLEGVRTLSVAFVYLSKENAPMEVIERKMQILLDRLRAHLTNNLHTPDDNTSISPKN